MKLTKYLIAAALIMAATSPATAKKSKEDIEKIYMFGFAASFNDTIVHFTEIQPLDSAWLAPKTKFLQGRDQYSQQLRRYLTQQNKPYRTCVIFYDKKLERLQKKFLKMRKLYTSGKKEAQSNNDVRTIPAADFKFEIINMSIETDE